MLTGRQIREARKLLRWTRPKLSRAVRLPQTFVESVESSDGPAWLTDEQEAAIQRALEAAGVEFTNGGEPGVKMRRGKA